MDEYVYFRGRVVGRIIGDTYITVRTILHFFRIFNGFGISQEVLEELYEKGVRTIKIIYQTPEGDRIFVSSIHHWKEYGYEWIDYDENGILDPQIVLPIDRMVEEGKEISPFSRWEI